MTDPNLSSDSEASVSEIITIYKKWHKTGFISIGYWPQAGKVAIEIGAISGEKTLSSVTKCFVPAYELLAYLRAETNNTVSHVFPKFETNALEFYGGHDTATGPVSRVFKIHYWPSAGGLDKTGRLFRCGHFPATKTAQGGFIPDASKPISINSVRMSLFMIAELFEILNKYVMRSQFPVPKD